MKNLRKRATSLKKDKRGFTLIELIIVIAIIGILSAIAIPSVNGYLNQAKLKADRATAETISTAALSSISINGIPTGSDDDAKSGTLKTSATALLADGWPSSKEMNLDFTLQINTTDKTISITNGAGGNVSISKKY